MILFAIDRSRARIAGAAHRNRELLEPATLSTYLFDRNDSVHRLRSALIRQAIQFYSTTANTCMHVLVARNETKRKRMCMDEAARV